MVIKAAVDSSGLVLVVIKRLLGYTTLTNELLMPLFGFFMSDSGPFYVYPDLFSPIIFGMHCVGFGDGRSNLL
jgi:hypothetical protein